VAIGVNALRSNTTFGANTAVGYSALDQFNGGVNGANEAFGMFALCGLTSGEYNVAVGGWSFFQATSGCHNTGVGHRVFNGITSACDNTALGFYAGCNITIGCCNVAIGPYSSVANPAGNCQLAIGFASGQNWLTGDSSKNIRPGAGILDCNGSTGAGCGVLRSTGTGIEWDPVGKANAGIYNAGNTIQLDNLRFAMSTGGNRSFMISTVSGSATVTWANSGVLAGTYAAGALCQNITLGTGFQYLCAGYNYPGHGSVQCATICYGAPVCCAYQFVGIVGCGYNNNVMNITRIF
jgi:hypothetical protein